MKPNFCTLTTCLLTLATSATAFGAAGAADPSAPVPAVTYKSPLSDYRPLGADKRVPWKAANDEVGRIGGWRAYAREAAAAVVSASSEQAAATTTPAIPLTPVTTAPKSPPADHAHHKRSDPKKELP